MWSCKPPPSAMTAKWKALRVSRLKKRGDVMAREAIDSLVNLDVAENKQRLRSIIGTLTGWWEVSIKPRRNTRSLQQNKWYWSQLCTSLSRYLSEQDYDVTTPEQAHEI